MITCGRGCVSNWDVRCRCLPGSEHNTITQFNNCSQKLFTLQFLFGNDYECYKYLQNRHDILNKNVYNQIKTVLFKTKLYKLCDNIYDFLKDSILFTIDDIRFASKMISKKIKISDEEYEEIINSMIEDEEFI